MNAEVNAQSRSATAANHSATHLLHAALQEVLGAHVQQKGSLVNNERLRFDFSHGDAMSGAEINEVERLVNQQVRANNDVGTRLMKLEDARAQGAAALFGERYEEDVRVVSMGEFSLELCGGTHVRRTGDIGSFRINPAYGEVLYHGFGNSSARSSSCRANWLQAARAMILPARFRKLTGYVCL